MTNRPLPLAASIVRPQGLTAAQETAVSQDANMWSEWRLWLEEQRVVDGMPAIASGLNALRARLSDADWAKALASPELLAVRNLVHEDPYTRRGFEKPRGYAGDAVLLDYIYGVAPIPECTSALGRAIYAWCDTYSQAWRGVRRRRRVLAAEIDATAARVSGARILSVACGHLREAQFSEAIVGADISELVAIDQDAESLRVVDASCAGLPVTCVHASVSDLLRRKVVLGQFDLIYTAGLYDYLESPLALVLTQRLWELVRPGGRLLTANFVQIWERGYIEAMMHWALIYRESSALLALAPQDARAEVCQDEEGVIAYLRLDRACNTIRAENS